MGFSVREITENDLEKIMYWRMMPHVTKYMNTDPKLTLSGQKKWFQSIKEDPAVKYWLVEVDGTPAGILNLADIDQEKKYSSWGYYIGEKSLRSMQLAVSLELSLYDYVFEKMGFEEIHGEIFSLNKGVIKLHLLCGCKITEEVKGEVEKNGVKYDVTHICLTKAEWEKNRGKYTYEKIEF